MSSVQSVLISQNPSVRYDQTVTQNTHLVDQSPYLVNSATLVNPVTSVQYISIKKFISSLTDLLSHQLVL